MRKTTLDIFADILQRLRNVNAHIGITTTMEMDEFQTEDNDGNEILIEAGPAEIFFIVEEKIVVDAEQRLIVDGAIIEDVAEGALFDIHASHDTNMEIFCTLLNELADAGFGVQAQVDEEDVRVLDIEHIDNIDGLTEAGSFLSRGKFQIWYIAFESDYDMTKKEEYQIAENIPSYHNFFLWYNKEEVHHRVYPEHLKEKDIEDVLDYYKTAFIPMIQAARRNGEIPSLIFH